MTRYQWLVLLVAWFGWVFDIMDTALFNFAKQGMLVEALGSPERYNLVGKSYEGQLATIFLVGWATGGLAFGILADRWGRTRTMILTILLYCAFTGLTALCRTYEQIAVMRFLTALGIGGEWAAGASLLAEVFPSDARKYAAGFLQSAAAVGPWAASYLNLVFAGQSWRWLFVVGVLPAFVTVLIRMKVREPARTAHPRAARTGSLRELFGVPRWRRNAMIGLVLGVVGIIGAWNTSYWLPNLVQERSIGVSATELAVRKSEATSILHIGTLMGVILFPILCDRIGRRRAFALFFLCCPVVILGIAQFASDYRTMLFLAPLMSFFTIGLTAGFALYFPELFPTHIRATGAGFCYNTGRIVSAPLPQVAASVMVYFGNSAIRGIAAFSLIYLVGAVTALLAPETRGKPLPEE